MKQIIKSDRLNESYTQIKDKSGLTIILYPKKKYSTTYALFGTKYGSIHNVFKMEDDKAFTEIPAGVAHFLEHKLFENEEGDAFSLFAKTGASANAYTTFDRTCYLFSCADNFEKSLSYLLQFVQNPFFSEKTVEKEQGIIGQEIKMYEDNPNWRVYFNLLSAMYVEHPVRIDIAGTVESISKIDAKLLYKCYETFYNLNNMVLVIVGNFDEQITLEIINQNLKQSKNVKFETKLPDEPREVFKTKVEQSLEVAIPLFNIGYKEKSINKDKLIKATIESEILLDMIAGEGSELYRELYDKGLINATFGAEIVASNGYFAHLFEGESKNPEQVQIELNKKINEIKQSELSQQAFERSKKQLYGRYIRMFNSVDGLANSIIASHFSNSSIFETIEIVANLKLDDIKNRLNNSFDEKFSVLSKIIPKD